MELYEIETMKDITTYSSNKNLNVNAGDLSIEAEMFLKEKKTNTLYFDFWSTQMPLQGRNQLPSTSSQYIYLFKVVKVGSKNHSIGIVFPLDFDTTVSKVENGTNGNIKFHVKPNAKYFSYNRSAEKYVDYQFKNYDPNSFSPSSQTITPIMDSNSPDHPKTQIAGSVWI